MSQAATTVNVEEIVSMGGDVVKKFLCPSLESYIRFGDELLDIVAALKGVEVEDVRREILGPLRKKYQEMNE